MKVLKKIGCILFCLLPILLAFGLQLLITFAGLALRAFYLFHQDPSLIGSFSSPEFQRKLLGDSQFLMALSVIYGIASALALGFWYWKWCFPKKKAPQKAFCHNQPCHDPWAVIYGRWASIYFHLPDYGCGCHQPFLV